MKLLILFKILILISNCYSFKNDLTNVLALTENFFSNLNQIDFGNQINVTRKFIDHQIDHYIDLLETTHGLNSNSKLKRSLFDNELDVLSMDFNGVHVLNGFFNQTRIPVRNPIDIKLFKHDFGSIEVWYAATLQNERDFSKDVNSFILYKYEDESYIEISNITVMNALNIAAFTLYDVTFIIVSETLGAYIYTFDLNEKLYQIQQIDLLNPTSIEIWQLNTDIIMAITQETENILIFKWIEKQFEIIQNIEANNARKIISFEIENETFLAVANYKNDKGETDIFSEIYKYNVEKEIFLSYQHILSYAAVDIKYFCFQQNHLKDVFLIVANSYEKDFDGQINYETNSIVYKYVEDYFMPFQSFTMNNIEQWLPIVGLNGEFILLASSKNSGITAFQYDGWRFVKSEVQYTQNAFGKGVKTLQSYLHKDQQLIVVANENDHGNMENVFAPSYSYQNIMHDFQKGMNEWCQRTMKELDLVDLKELNRLVEAAPKLDDSEIHLNSRNYFHNVRIYNLVLDEANIHFNHIKKRSISYLEKQIDDKAEQLNNINEKLRNRNEPIVFNGNVQVQNLEIDSDRIVFEDVHTKSINNIQLEKFFNDVFFIDDPFDLNNNLHFEDIIFEGFITPKFINNIPKQDLIYTHSDISFLNSDLIVEGNINVENIFVAGFFDRIPINLDNILLVDGNQTFHEPISISNVQTDHLFVNHFNSINMFNLQNRIIDIAEHNIDTLTVKNITIGYINGMDMEALRSLVFRKTGEQTITGDYEFESLTVDDFEIDGLLANTSLDHLTYTTNSTNLLLQSIIFTEDLQTDHLHVIERINQIRANRGKLDVLLKDEQMVQHVTGPKTFESINLMGPIQLRGQIQIKGLEPPIIHKKLTLKGDYVIKGDTTIEKTFKFQDLAEPTGTYSMDRLESKGLKLEESDIPVHLDFKKGFIVDKIDVDTINEQNVKSWIVFENDIPEISGHKTFENDLNITGDVFIKSINGYNLIDLYKNILRKNDNQFITGQHVYNNISTIRLVSNKTIINDVLWKNVMTLNENQTINGTSTLWKPIKVAQIEIKSATIKKNILNHNFDKMIEDTLFNDTDITKKVTGKKYFQEKLVFLHLNISHINNVNLKNLENQINTWFGDIHINKTVKIPTILEVDQVYCNDLNGISNKDFGNVWLLRNGEQTVDVEQFFKNVYSKNKVFVASNSINNVTINELDRKAIKIHEKHRFKLIEFGNQIKSQNSVTISGKINNIDINDALLSNGLKNQTILSRKFLQNNLTVNGYLHVNGLLSGVNLTLLKYFTDSTIIDKNMNVIIDGNINFRNEFDVNTLNNYNIKEISKNVWYTDKEANIQGFVSFENVVFEDELLVDGYVDDIELVWLSKNYFSKTKDQKITAKLDFIDGVIFGQDLQAEHAQVAGLVANISIENFNRHILRNDDQIFDFHVLFEELEVVRKFDANLINHLNLESDVMRYDATENIVTGFKTVRNLNAVDLIMEKGTKLQNIDVDYWFRNAVYINGNFTINGLKTLKNAKFEKNINLQGLLNSYTFDEDHILTTHTKQKITGQKNFITSGPLINSSLVFDILKLKGFYNNIDIEKLIEVQIDKSKENIPISSKKHFFNDIIAKNINIKHLYQNIDITDLIKNISTLPKFKNYENEYAKLINFSKNILTVLKHQPYFLQSFKQIQSIKTESNLIFSFKENENENLILVKIFEKSATLALYNWDETTNVFVFEKDIIFKTNSDIVYSTVVDINEKKHLYLEEQNNDINGYSHLGTIYELSTEKNDNINTYFVSTLGTSSLTSFKLPNKNRNCVINLQNTQNKAFINCENEDNIFTLYQQIDASNGKKISAMDIKNIPYIFLINLGQNTIDNSIEILKYNEENGLFNINEVLELQNVINFDIISFKNSYYLVVAIKHHINIENPGLIIIYKYDINNDKFKEWQKINAMDPTEVKFNILTSDELVLYVLSNCPSEPFTVYQYNGIAGFKSNYVSSTIPIVSTINPITSQHTDFIAVSNKNQIRIIKALYKGKKFD